ncbi:MAG: amidohydrolase [Oscillospiraceae bacterium]|nr:amidohydrolase [Oscillospiraceae bacterium]
MANYDLIVRDVTMLDKDYEIQKHMDIAISGNRIAEIGEGIQEKAKEEISGKGLLAMPGLVDAHHHNAQQLLRAKPIDEYPMVWTRFLVPFESSLTEEDMYISSQLSMLEMIKGGTTAFADAGGPHMEMTAKAAEESGMRGVIARSTMDMGSNIPDSMKCSAEENIRRTCELFDAWNGAGNGRVRIWFGIRQVMTCSWELLEMTSAKAKELGTGMHAHLCEHKDEVSFCLTNYRMRPAELLEATGCLGPNLLTAHNVVLSESDIALLAERHVGTVHCPRSNLTNHGFPKTPRMLQQGLSIGLGSDGAATSSLSLWDEVKVLRNGLIGYWGLPIFDPVVIPYRALLRMMSQGGADAIMQGDSLGSIETGKKADIILLDIDQPHLTPTHNLGATIVEAACAGDVRHSIIDGKIVMKDRKILTMDEEKIMYEAAKAMEDISRRAGI